MRKNDFPTPPFGVAAMMMRRLTGRSVKAFLAVVDGRTGG
jgi:hypothetical protein